MARGARVVDNGDGTQRVDLGALVSMLLGLAIASGAGAMVTVGVLTYRASAEEAKVEQIDKEVRRQSRNQIKLDENQRRIRQDAEWANLKLDALLEALQVTERVPRPALPPPCLEKPTEEAQ